MEDLTRLIIQATEEGANDIFLTENKNICIRVEGKVEHVIGNKIEKKDIEYLAQKSGAPSLENRDWDGGLVLENNRYRINAFHSFGELAAVLRPIKNKVPNMNELGLPVKLLESWLSKESGLILATGATGSGKSTTLAACIQWINENLQKHIITIEDPIEYSFENNYCLIHQRQIGQDVANFPDGLRSALRQSPDIILVGEIRDYETAKVALQASETGHLVIGTLHSKTAIDSVERISNILAQNERAGLLKLLSVHLIGIISQKLLPKKNGGLFLAMEHFENQAATREWIQKSEYDELKDFIQKSRDAANLSFLNCLIAAVKADFIDAQVALKTSDKEEEFLRAMRGIS